MRKFISIFLTVIMISYESCILEPQPKTELEKLPPATQQGKDTFGCLVNGKAWVTRTTTDAYSFYQSGVLQISADVDETNREQHIDIIILHGLSQGTVYDLTNDPHYESKFSWARSTGICFYEEENTLSGQLTITKLDQINLIISGLFEFATFIPDCDTIKVTDGRFDLHYAN